MKNIKAYTLTEIVTVMIILGVFATIAVPKYISHVNQIKNQEAIVALQAIYQAQKDYSKENNGAFEVGVVTSTNLDVDFPNGLKNFNAPEAVNDTFTCNGVTKTRLGLVEQIASLYELFVSGEGKVYCLPCPSTICTQMGFSSSW